MGDKQNKKQMCSKKNVNVYEREQKITLVLVFIL